MVQAVIDGMTLEYESFGRGEPVIFIHGAFIVDTFGPLVRQQPLAQQHRTITYSRRGYGASEHGPGPVSVKQHAADCRALLAHLDVPRVHVVGHSYGGCVALQLALDAPELAHTLVLLEPALMVGASAESYRDSLAAAAQRFREAGAEVAVDEFIEARWPHYRERLDRDLPGAFAQAAADAASAFEGELQALPDWKFGPAEAARITCPVLSVLGGESNAIWPRFGEAHERLLAWLPNAEGFVLPGTTHFLQIEDPQGTGDALASFLSRHSFQS
jgi:pimeloyl-ACP methyl ester carboxylesterase